MTNEGRLPPLDNYNGWADYHRYQIGVNVIPADTKNKKPTVEWVQYQDNPISEWQHEKWKSENAFSRGMAVIAGKVWHRQDKKDYYDKILSINPNDKIASDSKKRLAHEEYIGR